MLGRKDFIDDAALLGIDVEIIQAVAEVESQGTGFLPDGRPKILFEGHVFWRELSQLGLNPNYYRYKVETKKEGSKEVRKVLWDNRDVLYSSWTKKHYKGGAGEYKRLNKAESVCEGDNIITAANKSASFGMFQIMGFNYKACGFDSIDDFVAAMTISENEQLMIFTKYVKARPRLLNPLREVSKLIKLLGENDSKYKGAIKVAFAQFARYYNGALYTKNQYDIKLVKALNKYANLNI